MNYNNLFSVLMRDNSNINPWNTQLMEDNSSNQNLFLNFEVMNNNEDINENPNPNENELENENTDRNNLYNLLDSSTNSIFNHINQIFNNNSIDSSSNNEETEPINWIMRNILNNPLPYRRRQRYIVNPNVLDNNYFLENFINSTLENDKNKYKRVIDDEEFKNLKRQKYKNEYKETYDASECPIFCVPFEEDDDIIILPCNHLYTESAIEKWLTEESNTCPVCRYEFKYREIKKEGEEGEGEGEGEEGREGGEGGEEEEEGEKEEGEIDLTNRQNRRNRINRLMRSLRRNIMRNNRMLNESLMSLTNIQTTNNDNDNNDDDEDELLLQQAIYESLRETGNNEENERNEE